MKQNENLMPSFVFGAGVFEAIDVSNATADWTAGKRGSNFETCFCVNFRKFLELDLDGKELKETQR